MFSTAIMATNKLYDSNSLVVFNINENLSPISPVLGNLNPDGVLSCAVLKKLNRANTIPLI
jgi:hypothetical protein